MAQPASTFPLKGKPINVVGPFSTMSQKDAAHFLVWALQQDPRSPENCEGEALALGVSTPDCIEDGRSRRL